MLGVYVNAFFCATPFRGLQDTAIIDGENRCLSWTIKELYLENGNQEKQVNAMPLHTVNN